jgi:hypothetical protein
VLSVALLMSRMPMFVRPSIVKGAASGTNLYAATKGDSDVYRSEFVADIRSCLTHCLRNARDEAESRPRVDDWSGSPRRRELLDQQDRNLEGARLDG